MTITTRTLMTGLAVLLVGSSLAPEEAAPDTAPRPGCARVAATGAERGPLGEGQQEAIAEALQDEYAGEAVYARVLKDLGEVRPFSKVVHAEQRHAAFLEELLTSRDLPVPENRQGDGEVPSFASRQEACSAAVELETRNVALYDRLLATGTLPEDVRRVFEHNRMASLEHHRPAFERCAGAAGGRAGGAAVSGRRGCGGQGGCRCGGACGPGPGRGRCRRGGGPTASAPGESGS